MMGRRAYTVVLLLAAISVVSAAGEEEAKRQWREHRDLAEELLAHRKEAVSEDAMRAADAEYAKAVRIAREHDLTDLAVKALVGRLDCRFALSDYPGALTVSREILSVQAAIPGKAGAIARTKTRCDIGYLLQTLGSPRESVRVLSEAAAEIAAAGDELLLAAVHMRLAGSLHDLSEMAASLRSIERAVRTFEKAGDSRSLVEALNIQGTIHSDLGNTEYALLCFERGLKLDPGSDAWMMTQLIANSAIAHLELGKPKKAWERLTIALRRTREAGDTLSEATTCFWLGRLYREAGMPEEALTWSRKARKLASGDPRIEAWAWLTEGGVLLDKGRNAPARVALDKALGYVDRLGDRELRCRGETGLAELSLRAGKTDEAIAHLTRSLEHVGGITRGLTPLTAMRLRQRFDRVMDGAVRAAMAAKDLALVFDMLERTRAGVLMSGIGGRDAFAVAEPSDEIRQDVVNARAAACAARDRREQALEGGLLAKIRQADRQLVRATSRHQEALERWYRASPGCVVGESLEPRTLDETRDALSRGEVIVLYSLTGDELHALVVRKAGATLVDLGKAAPVVEALARLRESLAGGKEVEGVDGLRKRLIAPLALSTREKRLLVSPDGPLASAPFALIAPEREVVFVPSASSWVTLAERDAGPGERLIAMGAPDYSAEQRDLSGKIHRGRGSLVDLPQARAEVLAIRREGDLCLLGAEATESALRDSLTADERWRAVHFACHGIAHPRRPGTSCVALAPDGREDGFLTVLEILGMRVRTDLVTLSACETGVGRTMTGEGLVALPAAFLHAGAPRVIASLWNVDDEATRILMEEFYRLWNPKRGKRKISAATALKGAQEAVRKRGYDHPGYWAGWVLWGRAD